MKHHLIFILAIFATLVVASAHAGASKQVKYSNCGTGWGMDPCSDENKTEEMVTPEGPVSDMIVIASKALIPEAAKWLYKNATDRGVIGASWDHYRATNIAAALKLNKKGPVFALAGTEVLATKGIDRLLEKNPDAGRLRLFVAPALDFIWLYEKAAGIKKVRDLKLLKAPASWNFIAGPQVNIPMTNWDDWTWRTHTRLFIAFTAKGG